MRWKEWLSLSPPGKLCGTRSADRPHTLHAFSFITYVPDDMLFGAAMALHPSMALALALLISIMHSAAGQTNQFCPVDKPDLPSGEPHPWKDGCPYTRYRGQTRPLMERPAIRACYKRGPSDAALAHPARARVLATHAPTHAQASWTSGRS